MIAQSSPSFQAYKYLPSSSTLHLLSSATHFTTPLSSDLSPTSMATSTKTLISLPSSSLLHHQPNPNSHQKSSSFLIPSAFRPNPLTQLVTPPSLKQSVSSNGGVRVRAVVDSNYSSKRSSSSEPRETIMLPGCDYNHWLIVMEFPKDPAPTREQMIDTYLNTLASVLGSMEEAKKNMYAFSTTTYTGFQCTVSEETSERFKGLPGVLWVLPDSYIDVKNKDYGGDKYINGEIIPGNYPVYQPNKRRDSKYESRRYERKRDGPPPEKRKPSQEASKPESR